LQEKMSPSNIPWFPSLMCLTCLSIRYLKLCSQILQLFLASLR